MTTEKYQQQLREISELDATGLLVPYLEARKVRDEQKVREIISEYNGIVQKKFREIDILFEENYRRLDL